MEPPSHHELLCVSPDATADEIRASYRRLIRIYHPDVAGAAGAAMTQRLNEAQDALLNPGGYRGFASGQNPSARQPAGRPSNPRQPSSHGSWSSRSSDYGQQWASPHRTRPAAPNPRTSAEWMIVAIVAIGIIVVATIVVLAFTYSGPIGVSPRIIPAIIVALVWMTAGLSRPPVIAYIMLGLGILLWPLTAAHTPLLDGLAITIPSAIWVTLTLSFVAMILLRIAAPRAAWHRTASAV